MTVLLGLGTFVLTVASLAFPGALGPAAPTPDPPEATLNPAAPYPVKQAGAVAPVVQAKSALLVDLPSGVTLYSQNPDARLPIASITKLMTAMLAVERTKPDDIVTVPPISWRPEESVMGLRPGDQLSVNDLVAGTLIVSGNDAASVLARHVSGSDERFVEAMNRRAEELGMRDTHFDNPAGYGAGENVSTARDLVVLSRASLAHPQIRTLVAQGELTVAARNLPAPTPENPAPTEPNKYVLRTTDALIGGYLPIAGLKTGTSDAAGPSLVSLLASADRRLLAIVLNSPDRFQENKSMLDWALSSHRW